jgi:hypothetical protein
MHFLGSVVGSRSENVSVVGSQVRTTCPTNGEYGTYGLPGLAGSSASMKAVLSDAGYPIDAADGQ